MSTIEVYHEFALMDTNFVVALGNKGGSILRLRNLHPWILATEVSGNGLTALNIESKEKEMADGKIEITVGGISFVGEGETKWVSVQLDKILAKIPELMKIAPQESPPKRAAAQGAPPMGKDSAIAKKTLPAFLREKSPTSQTKKFLATAVWLEAEGATRISTSDVITALKKSKQSKLANASNCLAQNVTKGYCEKDDKQFFVTQDGKESL